MFIQLKYSIHKRFFELYINNVLTINDIASAILYNENIIELKKILIIRKII